MDTIINKSTITARITHHRVKLDLLNRGWIPIDAAEEQPFDIILDVGIQHNDTRQFQTLQVKSWSALKTSSRTGALEPVSAQGKTRNNYDYYDECIDWIATVKDNRVIYWNRNTYQRKTPAQRKKTTPTDFPFNDNVYDYVRPSSPPPVAYDVRTAGDSAVYGGCLESFMAGEDDDIEALN